jgi:hypothetical protein
VAVAAALAAAAFGANAQDGGIAAARYDSLRHAV